jgi:hypothetical protein
VINSLFRDLKIVGRPYGLHGWMDDIFWGLKYQLPDFLDLSNEGIASATLSLGQFEIIH